METTNEAAAPRTVYGAKYDRNLRVADISKAIRADIKAAIKSGELPAGLKTSVRSESFAGGQGINVQIVAFPSRAVNPEAVICDIEEPHRCGLPLGVDRHTPEASAALKTIEAIMEAYNYDGSDRMTDYWHVNFYGSVKFDWQLEDAERTEIREEYAAQKAADAETAAAPLPSNVITGINWGGR